MASHLSKLNKNTPGSTTAADLKAELQTKLEAHGLPPCEQYIVHRVLERTDNSDPVCAILREIKIAAHQAVGESSVSDLLGNLNFAVERPEISDARIVFARSIPLDRKVADRLRSLIEGLDLTQLPPIDPKNLDRFRNDLSE